MVSICKVCGAEFIATRKGHVYCSKKCRDHVRYIETGAERVDRIRSRDERIVALYDSDLSAKEIAEKFNVCPNVVYKAWNDAGLPKRLTEFQRKVKTLREEGLCAVEIARRLNKKSKQVIVTAKAIGMPFTKEESKRSKNLQRNQFYKESEKEKKEYVEAFLPEGFSYVSGYVDSDHKVIIRCNTCGKEFERSMITIRHKREIICPHCFEALMAQKKASKLEEEALRRQEEIRKRTEEFWAQSFEQKEFSISSCKECGAPFVKAKHNSVFCSDECRRKAMNRRHDRRLKRASVIDKNITLQKVYKRDKGRCWICGGKCDYNDYEIRDGHFVALKNYPSIDHVLPLAKGGNHTFENVRLAHCYCNTLKNDKVVAL